MTRTLEKWTVACVLILHVSLLALSAIRHSPVVDEVGHLPAGLSHWRLQRFDLYNVNPPLVRTLAAAPLHFINVPIDFSGYQVLPQRRSEFAVGAGWITTNQDSFLRDFSIARWACVPFSVLGGVTCFLWARELYGSNAGMMALSLWCFCPNVLGHASLITPDAGAAAVGVTACYVFRKWLMHRTLGWATASGVLLGLTLLTKFTWLFLLGLWPLCWIVVRSLGCSPGFSRKSLVTPATMPPEGGSTNEPPTDVTEASALRLMRAKNRWRNDLGHISLIAFVAFWVMNNGYLFEDSFQPLGKFQFFSQSLSGHEPGHRVGEGDNRFRGTLLEHLPVPVPRNFLQGIDHIKFEYELGYPSYLRGVKRDGGWWYYYLYAMLVKMPVGTLVLIGVAVVQFVVNHRGHGDHRGNAVEMGVNTADDAVSRTMRFSSVFSVTSVVKSAIRRFCGWFQSGKNRTRRADAQPLAEEVWSQWFETLYLLAPAVGILWLVSSQTGFNHHLRYVLPAFPFLFIFAGRTALLLNSRWRLVRLLPVVCVLGTIISSLSVYPHSLSYFNELSGGSINGWRHLDYSNIDWGQDLILVKEWVEQHPNAKPLHIHSTGYVTPEQMGIETQPLQMTTQTSPDGKSLSREFAPGWYIVGLTQLVDPYNPFHELLKREPDGYIGYSMRIYHVQPKDGDAAGTPDVGPDPQH